MAISGEGRSLASPAFPDDEGSADARIMEVLASGDVLFIARELRAARLLATVVSVLDALDDGGGDKDSHMAVVSMVNAAGEKGLLAFTSVVSLAAWNPEGRPVPAWGRDVARAAIDDGAHAVVIDVADAHRVVLEGMALQVLADDVDIERASGLVQVALAHLTSDGWVDVVVRDGRPGPADVVVELTAPGGAHPDGRGMSQLARQAADALAGRADLAAAVPGGIAILTP